MVQLVKDHAALCREIMDAPEEMRVKHIVRHPDDNIEFECSYVNRHLINLQGLSSGQREHILKLKGDDTGFRRSWQFTKEELHVAISVTRICDKSEGAYMAGLRLLFSEARSRALLKQITKG